MSRKQLRLAIIGTGYRAGFYIRIAKRYPDYFHLEMLVCHSEEKAERLQRELGCRVVYDKRECEEARPDLIIIAVNKASIAEEAQEWIKKGFPVLTETPVANSVELMEELWGLKQEQNAKIFVAEQYHRYPTLMPGLEAVNRGIIGEPQSAYLSLAHDYHGASLLRRMLRLGIEDFSVMGIRCENPVVETDSRYGAITDGRITNRVRDLFIFQFDSGKTAVYDFSGLQYHSFIRSRHLTVRGSLGEWNDNELRFIDKENNVHHEILAPAAPERYSELMKSSVDGIANDYKIYSCNEGTLWELSENSGVSAHELCMDNAQDEFAIASLLFDIKDALDNNEEAYPLREALEDAYTWLKMEEAALSPGKIVKSEKRPWQEL